MQRSLTYLLLVLGLALRVSTLHAQSTPAAETEDAALTAPAETNCDLPFDISGAVDAYYLYNRNGDALPTSFSDQINGFALGMANLILSREGKVGFVADLAVGPRAEAANGFQGTTLAAIKQLYLTYSPFEWMRLTGGNFSTFVGYELIDAKDNLNYTTSYLFSNGPFFHTGLKADFQLSESFGAMLGVFNDTDNKYDFTSGKHLGAQLSYSAGAFEFYFNFLEGKSVDGDSLLPDTRDRQFDLVSTFQATEKLGLGLNLSHKTEVMSEAPANSRWYGGALYANYAFSPSFTLAARAEYFKDPDALVLGVDNASVLGLTLSGNISVGALRIIPEFRLDNANQNVFIGGGEGKPFSKLPAMLLAAVYAF
jgi:hypothetical protein